MKKPPWRCPDLACGAMNSWVMAYCEHCETARPAVDEPLTTSQPRLSCWTCDACHTRTPGQPVIYQPDGPGGTMRGLCSACHFELRIRTVVRAAPEDVRANVAHISAICDRLTRRLEV